MTGLKTQENNASVIEFIKNISTGKKQEDALALLSIMSQITKVEAKMWGDSIIGFGRYHDKNTTQGGSWPIVGFSPRKTSLTVYIMCGFDLFEQQLTQLGKHKKSMSCLYINKLSDIDETVLNNIIVSAIEQMKQQYECEM